LSKTVAAAAYFNLGSTEFATKEADLFVYLGWKASDLSVLLGLSRINDALSYSDFDVNNAAYNNFAIFSAVGAATDRVENIGKISAINSGTTNYYWSLPASSYVSCVPTYSTAGPASRGELVWVPTIVGLTGITSAAYYTLNGRKCHTTIYITGTSSETTFTFTLPFKAKYSTWFLARFVDNTTSFSAGMISLTANSATATCYKGLDTAAWTASGTKTLYTTEFAYEIY
jgi:hypothetical protein